MNMIKKQYIAPTVDVIEMEAENMLALSAETGNGSQSGAGAMSNKRQQPTVNTWSSTNWNTEEEF